jgi:hypothetical protein
MDRLQRFMLLGFLALLLISVQADDMSSDGNAPGTGAEDDTSSDTEAVESDQGKSSGPVAGASPNEDSANKDSSLDNATMEAVPSVAPQVVGGAAPQSAAPAPTPLDQAASSQMTMPALGPSSTPEIQQFLRELFRFNASEISQNVQATRDLLRQAEDVNSHVNVANQTLAGAQVSLRNL